LWFCSFDFASGQDFWWGFFAVRVLCFGSGAAVVSGIGTAVLCSFD